MFGESDGLWKERGIAVAGDVGEDGGSDAVAGLETLKKKCGCFGGVNGGGDFGDEREMCFLDVREGSGKFQVVTKSDSIGENEAGIGRRCFVDVLKQQRQGFVLGRIEYFGEDGTLSVG